jgi:predicted phosphodiesterase
MKCKVCGSSNTIKNGTAKKIYQQYVCKDCGRYSFVRIKMAKSATLEQIERKYTAKELQAIAKGGRIIPGTERVPVVSFDGERIRVGAITDTHIGHKRFAKNRLFQAFEQFKKEGVDFITHSGDVTEGMSHRPGHIYELDHLGYDAQKTAAIDIFGQWTDTDIYAIDVNHDRWFIKSNGALIVKDIAASLDNFHFLGHDEGDISLNGKAILKLWHGEDASSYALSYRLQKLLESLSGGEKPNALFAGHVHKYVHIFERNVHAVSVGTLEQQTSWMRGKRLAAHVGFAIADIWVNDSGISKSGLQWYPFYA